MSRVAEVIAVDRSAEPAEIKVDPEDPCTPDHYQPAGDDALPLAGDFAAVSDDDEGSSSGEVVGYHDPLDANRKASPGEKRIYARSADGVCVGEIWIKGDGSLVLKSVLASSGGEIAIAPSGDVTINGVTIDAAGNVTAPGTVTGVELVAGAIPLSLHYHAVTAPGSPSGPPVGGPPPPEDP
jgi:hypothetical protein